jgi:hypothetical protein
MAAASIVATPAGRVAMTDILLWIGTFAVFPVVVLVLQWGRRRRGDGSGSSGADGASSSSGPDCGSGDSGSCDGGGDGGGGGD